MTETDMITDKYTATLFTTVYAQAVRVQRAQALLSASAAASRDLDLVRARLLELVVEDVDVPEGRVRRLHVEPLRVLAPELAQQLVVLVRELDLLEVRRNALCEGISSSTRGKKQGNAR